MDTPPKRSGKHAVVTDDGTRTLYSAAFDECYHSVRDGALHESLTKHVIPALTIHKEKNVLTILDICFGLGYNTWATLHYIKKHNLHTRVRIVSPEFDAALLATLKTFAYPKEFETLQPIIDAVSREGFYEDAQCTVAVYVGDAREHIQNLIASSVAVDIVYQDPFSPRKNPLLWTREWFADVRSACADDAVLTTYSIAAVTRMGLHENGFGLYEYRPPRTRKSLIASLQPIDPLLADMVPIDMHQKIRRNPVARSLRDQDFMTKSS